MSRRVLKAASAVREVVSMAILAELKDPRVRGVTVTGVQMSPDMREAKVLVSIMGDEAKQRLSLRGLQNSAGFLQAKIAERIDSRYTPRLHFEIDEGVKKSIAVAQILQRVLPKEESVEESPQDESAPNDSAALEPVADESMVERQPIAEDRPVIEALPGDVDPSP